MEATDGRSGPKVLIVDDQGSNIRLLEQTLRRAGFDDVMSSVDPCAVLAMHVEHRYDLILLDLQMPKMNGFEVLAELNKTRATHPFAVLVISADPAQMVAVADAGGDSFLAKPFRLPDVVERVRLMLKLLAAAEVPSPATSDLSAVTSHPRA
jgi:DNA-binding response OmpR family regulator